MSSPKHGRLVSLFRARPGVAVEALSQWLGVKVPRYTRLAVDSGDLTAVKLKDLVADLVVLLHREKPVMGIVIEVQLKRDDDKLFSWPAYLANQRSRYRCPVVLLVVAPSRAVARWAAEPIDLGAGSRLVPLVLGPDTIPLIKSGAVRRGVPELAVLSSISHPADQDAALIAFRAIRALPAEQSTLYFELILAGVSKKLRQHFEGLMASGSFQYQSEFGRKHRAEGRAEGEAKGKAEAVLAVLGARGLRISRLQRKRIIECADLATLDRWLTKAVIATSVSAVFADS